MLVKRIARNLCLELSQHVVLICVYYVAGSVRLGWQCNVRSYKRCWMAHLLTSRRTCWSPSSVLVTSLNSELLIAGLALLRWFWMKRPMVHTWWFSGLSNLWLKERIVRTVAIYAIAPRFCQLFNCRGGKDRPMRWQTLYVSMNVELLELCVHSKTDLG